MKILFCLCIPAVLAVSPLAAQEDAGVLKAKLSILEAERDATFKNMAKVREELIKKDPTLRRMHEKILNEHRKLALLLDSKKEIHEMNNKLLKLDSEIGSVKAKLEAPKPALRKGE